MTAAAPVRKVKSAPLEKKPKKSIVARRLPVVGELNASKAGALAAMGVELDRLRRVVWSRFHGAKTAHLSKREIRDRLMREGSPTDYAVPQRLWRATVEDTVDKIRAWQRAVIVTEVRPKIYQRTAGDEDAQKRLLTLAKIGRWREDPWLSRQCREAFASLAPHSKGRGWIVADNCSYDLSRDDHGRVWLAVMTPACRKRLKLNLGELPPRMEPTSTVHIGPDGRGGWVVIAAYDAHIVSSVRPRNTVRVAMEGIDAGVTEVFTTTDGRRFGAGQSAVIAARAERDNARGKARNKIRRVRDKHLDHARIAESNGDKLAASAARAKATRIERHNLGKHKQSRQRTHDRAATKDVAYQSVHDLVDVTDRIVAEDLSGLRGKSKFGPAVNRRYSAWQRSFLADALASVPSRRGSAVTLVNPAYTSQQVHPCGHLGVRKGKKIYCQTAGCPQLGIVYDTEINAARNMVSRATDPEIKRFTSYQEVKRILLARVGTVENCPTTTQADPSPNERL